MIPVAKAIIVILDWLDTKPSYSWAGHPANVVEDLIMSRDRDGMIPYHTAHRILRNNATTKMIGNANKGMDHIAAEWRKLYL